MTEALTLSLMLRSDILQRMLIYHCLCPQSQYFGHFSQLVVVGVGGSKNLLKYRNMKDFFLKSGTSGRVSF